MARSRVTGPPVTRWEWIHWQPLLASLYASTEYPRDLWVWARTPYGGPPRSALSAVGAPDPFADHPTYGRARPSRHLMRYDSRRRNDGVTVTWESGTRWLGPPSGDLGLWARAHTTMGGLARFGPAGHGLVPAVAQEEDPSRMDAPRLLLDGFNGALVSGSRLRNGRVGTIHPAWLSGFFGWFSPAADPVAFGTPYLAFSEVEPARFESVRRWEARLVGIPGFRLDWANAEDPPGLARLVQMLGPVDDNLLVEVALRHGIGETAAARVKHDEHLAFMASYAPLPGEPYADF